MDRNWSKVCSVRATSASAASPTETDATRSFCATCGTHLFYFARAAGIHAVPIGLFDDQSGLPFKAEIFVDRQPDYYAFGNETRRMTGEEFLAQFR